MEVSGQIHAPAALPREKQPLVFIDIGVIYIDIDLVYRLRNLLYFWSKVKVK
jgi:hypothetical protein